MARTMATKSFTVTVAQLLSARARRFESVTPDTGVLCAVERMACNNVGSLIVVSPDDGRLQGILTERDVLVNVARLMSRQRENATLAVRDIMSCDPVTVDATATVGECLTIMSDEHHRFRHLPVTHDGELVGVLSIRDLCDRVAEDHQNEVRELSEQVAKLANVLGSDLQRYSPGRTWYSWFRHLFLSQRPSTS